MERIIRWYKMNAIRKLDAFTGGVEQETVGPQLFLDSLFNGIGHRNQWRYEYQTFIEI